MKRITFSRVIALCGLLFSTALHAEADTQPETPASDVSWQNGAQMDVPAADGVDPTIGIAEQYPSIITVSGMTGNIVHLQVLLEDVSHTFPNDMDILLVGPTGARSIIMSDAGDGFAGANNANLLFDSVNGVPLPTLGAQDTPLAGGTYLPTNYGALEDVFPAPGPGTLAFNEPADLSVFNGTDPNGEWKLYVVDDAQGDSGEISDGWRLIIEDDGFFEVSKTADSNDGVCDQDCSLREALQAAEDNGQGYDEIRFAASVFGTPRTISLTGPLPDTSSSLELSGPGAELLTVQREAGGDYRIFRFIGGASTTVTIRGMTISNGRAPDNNPQGGGIDSSSVLNLQSVSIENNSAARGGGVFLGHGGAFTATTISGNTATEAGGGIYQQGGGGGLTLLNTTVSGNHAPVGSGINSEPRFCCGLTFLEIKSSTIAHNVGGGSGIRVLSDHIDRPVEIGMQNTIVANNSAADLELLVESDGSWVFYNDGHNLTSDDGSGLVTGSSSMTNTDPKLEPLDYNGGSTKTHALPVDSPAINAGNSNGNLVDQRGLARPYHAIIEYPAESPAGNFGDFADMGAVEMHYLQVLNDDDSGAGSLRQALLDANDNGQGLDDILFDPWFFDIPRVINLAGVLPVINSNLNMIGPGADQLTVRRDTGGDYRILETNFVDIEVSISGMTVSNGYSTFGASGIKAFSRLVLTEMAISRNTGLSATGGLDVAQSARLIRTTISKNFSTGNAGGINFQPILSGARLTISDSTITGNTGSGPARGALSAAVFSGNEAQLEISSSTIAGNQSETNTGGISFFSEDTGSLFEFRIQNTVIDGNSGLSISTAVINGGTLSAVSGGFNLSDDNGGGLLTAAGDQINTPAKLAPLAYYGGPTKTHALMVDSPALDQGSSDLWRRDQRGFAGPFDFPGIASAAGGNGADIGAVEMQAIVVTNADDSGTGSLRQALLDANTNGLGHDDIVFAMPYFGSTRSIDLVSALPMVQSSLAIVGTGARKLVIRRDSGSLEGFQMLQVVNGERVSLSGVSISDGRNIESGGAGIVSNIPLFLSRTAVSDNQCEFCSSALSLRSDGYLEDCTISGNSAINDGATITFAPTGGGSLRINNCTLSGNSAPYALIDISSKASDVSGEDILVGLSDTTIVNNDDGLGIYNRGSGDISVSVQNSVVINNTSLNFWADALGSGAAGFVSWGHNIVGDDSPGVFIQPGDQVKADALLGPLAANGGPTETHFPQADSPVLDAGKCLDGLVHHDQRGFIRPFDFPVIAAASDGCDVGAVEWSDPNGDGLDDGVVPFANGFE